MQQKNRAATLVDLMRTCDNEVGGQKQGVFLQMSPAERTLLRETAYRARRTQGGIMRLGLRLAARAIAELGDG